MLASALPSSSFNVRVPAVALYCSTPPGMWMDCSVTDRLSLAESAFSSAAHAGFEAVVRSTAKKQNVNQGKTRTNRFVPLGMSAFPIHFRKDTRRSQLE